MMKSGLEYLRVILRCGYEMAFSYAIMAYFAIIFARESVDTGETVILALLFAASYFIREHVDSRAIIAVMHLAMSSVVFMAPYAMIIRLFWTVLTMSFLLGSSLKYSGSGENVPYLDSAPWSGILFCVIFYIFGQLSGENRLKNCSYAILIIILMMVFARIYVDGICRYMSSTNHMDGISIKTMLRANTKLVVLVMLLMLLVMLIFGVSGITDAIGYVIKKIINASAYLVAMIISAMLKFLSGLFRGSNDDAMLMDAAEGGLQRQTHGDSIIGSIIMSLIVVILLCVFLSYVFKAVKRAIIYLMQKNDMSSRTVNKTCKENVIVERIVSNKDKRSGRLTGYEERFRRLYRKEIEHFSSEIKLNANMTCDDIGRALHEKGLGDVENINFLYKSVRYGNIEADRDSVRKLRSLIRAGRSHRQKGGKYEE